MTHFAEAARAVHEFAQHGNASDHALPSDAALFEDVCFKTLMTLCHKAAAVERNEVLNALAQTIAITPDVFQASRVAMLCGVLVEWGADPTIALPAIVERLTSAFAVAEPGGLPRATRAWQSLRYLILPAMTMLCLDVKSRQTLRCNAELNKYVHVLAAAHAEVKFLQRLMKLVDDEELIVLHPLERKGFRVRLEGISTNFHLFSLLQEALVGDQAAGMLAGPRANRKVIATARGDMPHDRLITDGAVWHYYNGTGLLPDGTLSATPLTPWIMGEQTLREIPLVDGERVVLLGPPIAASRGWDSSFFTNLHDMLRSKVEVMEILSTDEVELRLRRLRIAPRDVP